MHGGDRRTHGLRGAAPCGHHGGFDLESGKELGHEGATFAEPSLTDVGRGPEGQHGACAIGQGSESECFGSEFTRRLIVVGDSDRELTAVGERGDRRVEPSVAVGAQTARARDLRAGQCSGHCRG